MIVSHALRCIFVHVQKTAGSSVEAVLRRNDPAIGSHFHQGRRHAHARELRDSLDETTRDIVAGRFRRDIDAFGYRF